MLEVGQDLEIIQTSTSEWQEKQYYWGITLSCAVQSIYLQCNETMARLQDYYNHWTNFMVLSGVLSRRVNNENTEVNTQPTTSLGAAAGDLHLSGRTSKAVCPWFLPSVCLLYTLKQNLAWKDKENIVHGYISLPIPPKTKPLHFLLFDAGSCGHRWYSKSLVAEKLSSFLLRRTMHFN